MTTIIKPWRMTYAEKQFAALRMWYRGGYSGYFARQVRRMLDNGYTRDDLIAASVDDTMREWVIKYATPTA